MRRAGVILIVFLALLGCRREAAHETSAESRTPPGLAGRFFPPEGWAWGLLKLGQAPAQRYGVAAPSGGAVGQVLILPGDGETAEAWFETARDLSARRYAVWVLEPPGDGASVAAMIRTVIRPDGQTPLFVLSEGKAATAALSALERERQAVAGLILSSPALPPGHAPEVPAGDTLRREVQTAWRKANPDLRERADWRLAKGETAKKLREGSGGVTTPTLVITGAEGEAAAKRLCKEIAGCKLELDLVAAGALHLARDPPREAWLAAIEAFALANGAAPMAAR